MPCDGTSDGEGADDVSDTDSGGVDVNKLCSRANPLVHYFGFRKLGLAPVALAVGCLLFMLVAGGVIAILVEFPVATPYVLPPGKISTGAIHPHTYILLTFYLSAITLFAAFCALVRGRDRGADLEALVLTRLKPSEIVFGLLRIPAIILPACVGVWHFAMLWWIKIQYPHVIESYGQGRGPENTYSWLFAIAGCHLLFTVYWIVTGWCAGGLRGLFMRRASFLLITPFVLLTLSNRVLLGGYFDVLDGLRRPMYFVDVPSRWILAWMGFFGLCSVALIGIRRQLIPLFMRAANPEEAIRTFWQSREEAAEEYPNDLAAARARMMDVVRESWIVNTLIALSVMIVTSTIFAAMQAEHHIEDFFVGSFALTIGSVAATVAVVLRRTWRESSPAFPVISGNLSWSSATQYSPILVAQVLGFGFPFLFSPGVDFSRFEYALSAFAGIFLGYLVFLLLLPRSNRRWVLIGLGYATFGLVLVMIFGAMFDQQNNEDFTYGMIKITRETDRAISATFPRALGSGLRAAGLFLGIAWLMGLRSILLQRIHESEVLNHPIGALSMDAVTDYPTNGTARV